VYFNPDKTVKVVFQEPVRAVTPGQSVVFYKDDELLGGGVIR
jgi:tRNA-specific 2-thiouridylase